MDTRRALTLTRRQAIQVGGAGLAGLTLSNVLRAEAAGKAEGAKPGRAKNVIFIWQQGGPPHQDMWDMKPDAPSDMRGEFKSIPSNLAGYQVCELMPKLAKQVNRLTVIRGVNHHIPDHNPGSMYMLGSGNPPNPSVLHPTWSSVVKKEFPEVRGTPTSVAVPSEPSEGPNAGLLGAAFQSFAVQADPSASDFQVRALSLAGGIDKNRLERRRGLLKETDRLFDQLPERPDLLRGFDKFHEDAHQIILSPSTSKAFQIGDEPDKVRDAYGRSKLGQRLLLARRLIQSGVRFVTISEPVGWDTHANNFKRLRENLPVVDTAVSTLLDDLAATGLLNDTMVMMFGEFGRTPKINAQAGRDHWAQAMSIILAGGGVPGGFIYGTTDKNGAYVTDKSHSPADFACTVYTMLGIDPHKHYPSPSGQPVPIVIGGQPIKAITGV